MKKKLLKTSLISLIIIMLLQVASFAVADKITLKTLTDKDTYTVGDKVTVTIDWTEKMECAEFYIKFDSTKLEFEKATYIDGRELKDEFTNVIGEGNLKFGYFGDESTKMLFIFNSIATGKTTISVSDPDGFADGNLDEPSSYDVTTYGSKEITINAKVEPKPDPQPQPQAVTLSSIAITKEPTKYAYKVGEKFDKTGMEVTATYSNGTKKVITNYTFSPAEALKESDIKVVISYAENGVTKIAEQKITVVKAVANNNTENKVDTNKNNTVTNTTNNKNNATTNTTNKKDNTTASGKMPQTGAESVVFIIALVAVIGTIGFVKYRGLSDI